MPVVAEPFPRRRLAIAALAYFGLAFGAGFLFGVVRVLFVAPRLGERYAELLEMPLMLAVIGYAARYVVHRFGLPPRRRVRLAVGVVALLMLVFAELLLSVILQGRNLAEYVATRDPVSGSAYLVMLVVFAAMPTLPSFRPPNEHEHTRNDA